DRHDDRDRPGRLLRRQDRWRRCRNDDIHLEAHEFAREVSKTFDPLLRPSILNRDLLALNPPQLAQALPEGLEETLGSWVSRGARGEKTYAGNLRRRLRFSGERHHEEAEGDEEPDR